MVFKASRLFRLAYQGYQLIQEQVVEEGLRAISVTQGIDTDDSKTWKLTLQLHGLMDEMLLEAIGDHVRAGLKGLFGQGYTTGALPVGYRRKEVDGPRHCSGVLAVGSGSTRWDDNGDDAGAEVTVWLREPPRMDRYAKQARQLYEEEGLSFRVIGERLGIRCAGAWQAYRRYYEMIGQPAPPRRPACGHQRCSA